MSATHPGAADPRAAREQQPSARRALGAWAAAGILVATLVAGCGTQATPSVGSPAPGASAVAPVATPAQTDAPAAYADTLRVGWVPGLLPTTTSMPVAYAYRGLPGTLTPAISFTFVVYGGLYRFDAHYGVVPDLADGPCFVPVADDRVIRCRLVEATFHDGTPVTSDDVAYSFDLWQRVGGMAPGVEFRVVDPRTIDFSLPSIDPTFLTEVLPWTQVLPRHAIETAYADLAARTNGLTAGGLNELVAAIGNELSSDPPVCTTRLAQVDDLMAKLGVHLYREDFVGENGAFDPCWYMQFAGDEIAIVAASLDATGLDAVAQALTLLIPLRPFPGTGPYRLVSETADRVHLEAFAAYRGGVPATRYLDFVPTQAGGSDLESGAVDLLQQADLGAAFRATAAARGVRVATPPSLGYYSLLFNVRPGRLFADPALRRALHLCIDLPRDVDAATGGSGVAIYGPVLPGSWGDDPDLPKPPRDVAAARRLIEAAGWVPGADGVYAQGGVRFATPILVRANKEDRVRLADLVASQARDCGMDLASQPSSFDDLLEMLDTFPHDIPGTSTPFDLYVGGYAIGPDPSDGLSMFATSQASDPTHPDNPNTGGFSDPAFDELLDGAKATYDQAERARLYRRAQEELAGQVPAIFLWVDTGYDALRSAVATIDGPLDIEPPNWAWQPERMVVVASP